MEGVTRMKLFVSSLIFCFFQLSSAANPPVQKSSEVLRVRLAKYESVRISGLALEFGTEKSRKLLRGKLGHQSLVLTKSRGVFILRAKNQKDIFHKGPIYFSSPTLSINNQLSTTEISFAPASGKSFHAIVRVPIEDYLLGVLPSEMPANWPIEALKAQAVASRSYALAVKSDRAQKLYDLDSTVADQVYSYERFQRMPAVLRSKIQNAVSATEGQVLPAQKHQVLKAYFHAHCGGQTKTSKEVWGVGGQSITVKDEFCQLDHKAHWQTTISSDILQKSFFENIQDENQVFLKSLPNGKVLLQRGPSEQLLSGDTFRQVLGYEKIKTSDFNATTKGKSIQLSGLGNGHGVGMCQTGARFMALSGSKYNEILKRYYGALPHSGSEYIAGLNKASGIY